MGGPQHGQQGVLGQILPQGDFNGPATPQHPFSGLPYSQVKKVDNNLLDDIILNFEAGACDAFVNGDFYVTQELADHYLALMREWKNTNPDGVFYLGQKRVLLHNPVGSIHSVPLQEILLREKPEITFRELRMIIAEENLPFEIFKNTMKFIGRENIENSVLDLYEKIMERGLADRLPEGFFESKIEGYEKISREQAKQEQDFLKTAIENKLLTNDGRYFTYAGRKKCGKDKEFARKCKSIGVKGPGKILAACIGAGLLIGLGISAGALHKDSAFFEMRDKVFEKGGSPLYDGPGRQINPVIWGDYAAWLDDKDYYPVPEGMERHVLEDIVIKNLVTGELTRIESNGTERSNLAMSGDWVVWEDATTTLSINPNTGNKVIKTTDSYLSAYNLKDRELHKLSLHPPFGGFEMFRDKIIFSDFGSVATPLSDITGTKQIFIYNITTGKLKQITFDDASKDDPKMFGDVAVWRYRQWARYPDGRGYHSGSDLSSALVIFNLSTNKTIDSFWFDSGQRPMFDVGEKYFVWTENDIVHTGRRDWVITAIKYVDLRSGEPRLKERILSCNVDFTQVEPKTSGDIIAWDMGSPETIFPPYDGADYCRNGVSVFDSKTNYKGTITDAGESMGDINIQGDNIIWENNGKIYFKQLHYLDWKKMNERFDYRMSLLANMRGSSSFGSMNYILLPVWLAQAGMVVGQGAYYGVIRRANKAQNLNRYATKKS